MRGAHASVGQRVRTTLLGWLRSRLGRGHLTRCRVAVAVAAVAVAVLIPAQPAAAHAVLVSSDPVNGSSLSRAPAVVQLRFSEDLMPTGSTARLVDAGGTTVPGARVAADSSRHRDLTLRMPTLAAGSYAVVWQVSGASDGHPTSGILVFTVDRAAAPPARPAGGGPVDALLRWLRLVLLSGLVGGLAMAGLVVAPAAAGDPGRLLASMARRVRRLTLGIGTVSAGAAVALMIVGFVSYSPTAWRLGQVAVCAAAAPVLLRLRRGLLLARSGTYPLRGLWIVATGLAGAALLPEALTVDAIDGRPLTIAASYLQMLAGCLVVGLVGVLVALLWRPGRAGAQRAAVIRSCRRPLVRWTVVGAALATAAGLYAAGREVDSPNQLPHTVAGTMLLLEGALALIGSALGLAGAVRLYGRRRLPMVAGRVPSRLQLAAGLACVLALLGTGVAADAAAAAGTSRVAASPSIRDGRSDDLMVSVSVVPNRPGPNGFTVEVASSRRPAPAAVQEVALSYPDAGSAAVQLADVGEGRFFGTATLGPATFVPLLVTVRRGGAEVSVPIVWSVPVTATPARTGRLARLVSLPVTVLLIGVMVAAAWWSLLSRRRWRVDV